MLNTAPGPTQAIADVVCLQNMLNRGLWSPVETSFIKRNIRILCEAAQAGVARVPGNEQKALQDIDPMLRARWDFIVDMWAIERWVEEEGFCRWELVAHRHKLGPKLNKDLRRGDTWRNGKPPEEILREKRMAAAKVQAANDRRSTERVLAAVDLLTSKRMKEFITVEDAVATGDTITAHGETMKILENLREKSKHTPLVPDNGTVRTIKHVRDIRRDQHG
jgi:hypothetical protein